MSRTRASAARRCPLAVRMAQAPSGGTGMFERLSTRVAHTRPRMASVRSGACGLGTVLAAALLNLAAPATAHALVVVPFDCLTGGSSTNCGIGEAQLTANVSPGGAGQVSF